MSERYGDRMGSKRSRSRSPPPSRRPYKTARPNGTPPHALPSRNGTESQGFDGQQKSMKEQSRLNQIQEDERMREWVAQEDTFVLKQAKKKAEIRVKEGRAKPIDWLTVTLRVIDPTRNPLDDEVSDADIDFVDPEGVFEGLSETQMLDLEKDIDTYLALETNSRNKDYWKTLKIVCRDRRQRAGAIAPEGRAVSSVSADIDRLLSPKSYDELEKLEEQIDRKLNSNEPIDTDYWEQLLRSLLVWKAKSKLKKVYRRIIESRLDGLRQQEEHEAIDVKDKLVPLISSVGPGEEHRTLPYFKGLDPDPLLQLRTEDRILETLDETVFLERVGRERRKVVKMGFVPLRQRNVDKPSAANTSRPAETAVTVPSSRFAEVPNEDFSQATKALYEKEVARGISENEEIFAGEEAVDTGSKPVWAHKYRPRKPRYFNRVQMGYEWNKYNQTHYDHDNPPPKVVQGYKFNIFYPDLIDKTKAPTYKIERENGRKRGQSFAPAGEEDTCLIRFIAGPPYEDIAFRIVDKEWDYSAKRERGFKSSFDKGILQLHFQFKKVYYRK